MKEEQGRYDVRVYYQLSFEADSATDALRKAKESICSGAASPSSQAASPAWMRERDIPKENW